jgi:S-DNA-T family DNA segregation ATPase FtsK/SpoIIIE
MTRNELIAQVALDFLKQQLEAESEGTLRFCMVGLDPALTVAIAESALTDNSVSSTVEVRVPSQIANSSVLPSEAISDESITHWRHCQLPKGKRGVLFAASHEELQRNDKSIEKITRIETDRLRELYPFWIERSGLTAQQLDSKKQQHLRAALQAANDVHAARTIEVFADYVLAVADSLIDKGLPLNKALDNSLPALRLPRYAGAFERMPEKARDSRDEWSKQFRRLHTRVRPLLVRESERGDSLTEQLAKNFEQIRDRLTSEEVAAIEDFLNADLTPEKWLPAQAALTKLDWRAISELFEGAERPQSLPMGPKTIKFFEDEFDDQLEDEDREILDGHLPKEPTDKLEDFFLTRREQLARDKKLYGQWEKYIYRNPQPFDDFLVGLLDTLSRLRDRTNDTDLVGRKLIIRIQNSREKSFWRGKNAYVGRYFAFRYRGLCNLLAPDVELDFGKLWDFYFPEIDPDLRLSTSGARDARQLKFEVELDPDGAKAKLLFLWEMPVNALATAMAHDLLQIASPKGDHALLPTADIARQSVSAKGQIQRISLSDLNTVHDVQNGNEGRLVAPNSASGDRAAAFLSKLEELKGPVLGEDEHAHVMEAFNGFLKSYTTAIRDWVGTEGEGISSSSFLRQADAYGALLTALQASANRDLVRDKAWREILRVGVANVGGGTSAAIIAPWHPLRMAEIHVKAAQAAGLIKKVLAAKEEDIFRADILFNQKKQELKTTFYPDVCVGFEDGEPVLLAAAETLFDYTLCEPPQRRLMANGEDALDIEPAVAARAFGAVSEQYLELLPHERTNFSVVLYNAESKALPSAIASELSSQVEQESELQCDLLLTHSQPARMRRIYEQQNIAVSEEAGSVMASEAARNFLSRLRVGFLDASKIEDDNTGRTVDLVLLQDVIARNAEIQWKAAPGDRQPKMLEHIPSRWSRRRPVGPGDTAAAVYLTSPVQPAPSQAYLNAIQIFLRGDNAQPGNVIPAREINFRDRDLKEVFKQAHRIGEWVVNFDELVDRRLLSNNGVKVIRHIHDRSVDRNIVVSTTSKPRLLRTLLKERLDRIDSSISAAHGDAVIDRLIDRANALSGQVVMRAARYGHFANELIGIVLSMQRLQAGLSSPSSPVGWYFLDDFASWFGQREEQIADIMAISPTVIDGKKILKIAFSEAKFVTADSYRAQAKKSARQLEETVVRVTRALDPQHRRVDRETWLHRIGEFMLEGMEPFDGLPEQGWDLHRWSDEVRQDRIPIEIAGFSHVFVHNDDSYVDAGGLTPLRGMDHCTQEIFNKSQVAAELRRFAGGQPEPAAVTAEEERGWASALVSQVGNSQGDKALEANAEPRAEASDELAPEPADTDSTPAVAQDTDQEASPETASDGKGPEAAEEAAFEPASTATDHRWSSEALARWAATGKTSDEGDEAALAWLEQTVRGLQRALRGYEMTAELLGARLTPNAALVRFRGTDDLTIVKIDRRRQELLTSHAIDVINILAAPREIIIMVSRPERAVLRLNDLWRQRDLPETAPDENTSLLLGARESDGEMLYLNVGEGFSGYQPHGPHTLIAGETGSGKGVLVQCLLLDICATNSPHRARIKMIDPKAGIDFPWLRRMPHLDGDLVTTQDEAITLFEELVDEMERRNRLLADAGATKLSQFNKKAAPAARLPRIWVFHDELADWMLIDEYRDAVETNVTRLGVKARAAGINLVMVTQRPDKDALPMQLRANLSNRLVLKVADKRNSELVLDEPGAERLLGRGHLAAKMSGEGKIILAQVPFATEDEIAELAEIIASSRA